MEKPFDDILDPGGMVDVASEQLRQRLNEIIAARQLDGYTVLTMLAKLSAGYIHQMQRAYTRAGADVVVEEDFQQALTAYLTSFDLNDVNKEITRMTGGEVN